MNAEAAYYVVGICNFMAGFALAVALISKVSMRPQAKQILKKAGLVKLHKAKTPKRIEKVEEIDWEDEKPMFS